MKTSPYYGKLQFAALFIANGSIESSQVCGQPALQAARWSGHFPTQALAWQWAVIKMTAPIPIHAKCCLQGCYPHTWLTSPAVCSIRAAA